MRLPWRRPRDGRDDLPGGAPVLVPDPADRPLPVGTDWVWRPAPWSGAQLSGPILGVGSGTAVTDNLKVFHDGRAAAVGLEPAGDGLTIGTGGFAGEFLSLVVGLPGVAGAGLTSGHILRLDGVIEGTARILYARLNLRHGPNEDALLRTLHCGDPAELEFDLISIDLDVGRIGAMWIDLLIPEPADCEVTIHDLRLSRCTRDEF
ncbi:MAG: DUF6478 family protein [Paracoccaceae bacterium]